MQCTPRVQASPWLPWGEHVRGLTPWLLLALGTAFTPFAVDKHPTIGHVASVHQKSIAQQVLPKSILEPCSSLITCMGCGHTTPVKRKGRRSVMCPCCRKQAMLPVKDQSWKAMAIGLGFLITISIRCFCPSRQRQSPRKSLSNQWRQQHKEGSQQSPLLVSMHFEIFVPCPSSEAPACEEHLAAEWDHWYTPDAVELRPGSNGLQAHLDISR